jgi:hypothetical protein
MAYTIGSAKDAVQTKGQTEQDFLDRFNMNLPAILAYKQAHGGDLEGAYGHVMSEPWPAGRSVKMGKHGPEMTKDRTVKRVLGEIALGAGIAAGGYFAAPAIAGALGAGGGAAGATGAAATAGGGVAGGGLTTGALAAGATIPGAGMVSGIGGVTAAGGLAGGTSMASRYLTGMVPSGGDSLKAIGGYLQGRAQSKSDAQSRADALLANQQQREDEQRKMIADFLTGQQAQRLGATQMDPYAQAKSLNSMNIRRSFDPNAGANSNFDRSAMDPNYLAGENTKFQGAANDEETKKKILEYLSQIGAPPIVRR